MCTKLPIPKAYCKNFYFRKKTFLSRQGVVNFFSFLVLILLHRWMILYQLMTVICWRKKIKQAGCTNFFFISSTKFTISLDDFRHK